MTAEFTLKATSEMTESERTSLNTMKSAVYPPEENAAWPGRHREWTAPGWIVLVASEGQIVSCTGIVLTDGELDGRRVVVAGVGGIATHPDHRRLGYAEESVDRAIDWMRGRGAEFALLVCSDDLVPYYSTRGWVLFEGTTIVRQFGEPEMFTFNNVMVRPVCGAAPQCGIIDLLGPPW